jgi:hypothetical protein
MFGCHHSLDYLPFNLFAVTLYLSRMVSNEQSSESKIIELPCIWSRIGC